MADQVARFPQVITYGQTERPKMGLDWLRKSRLRYHVQHCP